MDHSVPDELISAYFDGEVTPDERLEVERLLESSPEFRQQLDDTSKLSALLHSFPREAAPADLARNVQEQVEQAVLIPSASVPSAKRSFRREWTAFGGGILATVSPLILFVVLNSRSNNLPMGREPHFKDLDLPLSVQMVEQEKLNQKVNGPEVAVAFDAPQTMPMRNRQLKRLPPREESLDEATSLSMKEGNETRQSKEAATMPAASMAAPVAAPMAKSLEASLDAADTGSNADVSSNADAGSNVVGSQGRSEFLSSLSNGDVIVSKVADPDSTVAVVYFTVVDIVRDTNEFKVLLQRRSVRQLDDEAESAAGTRASTKENYSFQEEAKKKSARTDDLQLIFVWAPGDQLAGAIDEFSRNHPDLYWTPQPPIELPSNTPLKDVDGSLAQQTIVARDKADAKEDAVEDSKVVDQEAEFAFGALIARNNYVNNVDSLAGASKQEAGNQLAESVASRSMNLRRSASPVTLPVPASAQADLKSQNGPSDPVAQVQQNGQAYFRVATPNQALARQAMNPLPPGQNSPTPLLANATQHLNMFGGSNTPRYALGGSNSDGRSSRPVKMLIVLKSQQPAAANHVP